MRKGLKHSMIHIFCLRLVSDVQESRPACCHHSVSYVILHDRQHGTIPPNLRCLGLDVVWCQRVFAPVALGSSRSRKSVPVVFVVTSKIAGAGSSLVEPSLMVERCSDSSNSARVDPQVTLKLSWIFGCPSRDPVAPGRVDPAHIVLRPQAGGPASSSFCAGRHACGFFQSPSQVEIAAAGRCGLRREPPRVGGASVAWRRVKRGGRHRRVQHE